MKVRKTIKKAITIYQKKGLRILLKRTMLFFSWKLKINKIKKNFLEKFKPFHKWRRTDNLERWQSISPHINSTDQTCLDIGCASGFFTSKMADLGLLSVGIDVRKNRIKHARKIFRDKERCSFMLLELSPNNISKLPNFDVILLLTVYHHWCYHYGRENAEKMLRYLADVSNKIIFEPPGKESSKFSEVGNRPMKNGESIVEYYISLLNKIFVNRVDVKYIGTTHYHTDKSRNDPLFLIDCRNFSN